MSSFSREIIRLYFNRLRSPFEFQYISLFISLISLSQPDVRIFMRMRVSVRERVSA